MASLVSLKLLTRLSVSENLDQVRLKCNIGLAAAESLAKSFEFELSKFVHDDNAAFR